MNAATPPSNIKRLLIMVRTFDAVNADKDAIINCVARPYNIARILRYFGLDQYDIKHNIIVNQMVAMPRNLFFAAFAIRRRIDLPAALSRFEPIRFIP